MLRKRLPLSSLVLSLVALMALVSGCGAQPPKPAEPAPAPQAAQAPKPARPDVILATTTSTQDSGLLDVLLPLFEQKTGYKIKPVAVGTGQALAMGEQGNADVLLVHAPDAELQTVAKGAAIERKLVMHNDFVIVGPSEDPAQVKSVKTSAEAFKAIAAAKAVFVSRGDNSGTNSMEKNIWKSAGVTPGGDWYLSTGQGMGQTLNVASEKMGYTLTDRATFLATQKNLHLEIVLQGEPALLNVYHVMQVNPAKFPKVNTDGARAFSDFMVAKETQDVIAKYGADKYGQALFFPDAGKTEAELGSK